MKIRKAAKLFFVTFAFLLILLIMGCDAPAGVKNPGNTDPVNNTGYPRIDSVMADPNNIVFNYGDNIKPEIFTVYYLESVDTDPIQLNPATENEGGFLINGKKGTDYVKAGIANESQPGKYGDFLLSFSSSDDPSAKPYEFKVFVTVDKLQGTDANVFTKLELVREPNQMEYDRGESFNVSGMLVVAWFDGESPGTTIATGAKPLHVQYADLAIDEDELKAATTPGAQPKIKITYNYNSQTKEIEFPVTLKIANHKIDAPNGKGVTFQTTNQAATGAYVTVTTLLDSDYEMTDEGIVITTLDANGNLIGPLGSGLNEIAPEQNNRRFVFVMPRRDVKISAETVQKSSGLGFLNYKIEGMSDFAAVPGFVSDSHHLSYQLLIPADAAEQDKPLTIKAGPPTNLPSGSSVTVEIYQDKKIVGDIGISGTNKDFAEYTTTSLAAGQNHDYEVRINYKSPDVDAGVQIRNYKLRIMKESTTQVITYTYTGDYQTFSALRRGWYKVQGWGANGGNAEKGTGGKGGYAKGLIFLDPNGDANQKMPLYIYVGGAGGNFDLNSAYVPGAGGWNGGGRGGESGSKTGAGGGGATSISTVAGAWNSVDVLGNRIFVAGGGGGASPDGKTKNSHIKETAPFANGSTGGGLSGSPAVTVNGKKYGPYESYLSNGTPWKLPDNYTITPGQVQPLASDPTAGFNSQGFGQGGNGREGDLPLITKGNGYNGKGGGGGGWWGGRVSLYRGSDIYANDASAGGGGGSNYISGYNQSYGVSKVGEVYDTATGEYIISVTSKTQTNVYEGTGNAPTAGSPDIGRVIFMNAEMNTTLMTPDVMWEADPMDINLNKSSDGHGYVIITYIGGDDKDTPPAE